MPDNAASLASSASLAIKSKHSAMATFDNPSYFTISGESGVTSAGGGIETSDAGAKTRKFKSWFKLSKRAFRSKASLNDHAAAANDESDANNLASGGETAENHEKPGNRQQQQRELPDVVYYNFTPAAASAVRTDEALNNNDDDVFSEVCVNRSTRTLNRRRHSLGSWFRSSLAVVRKNHAESTGSGLEASGVSRSAERPSTSSERALLSRHVSASAHCVSYSNNAATQAETPARPANPPAPKSAESKSNKRPRLPVSIKSTVELRARARYARQEKLMRSDGSVRCSASTSRVPRSGQSPHQQRRQTASLDRRYTNSTEVLASKSEESGSAMPGPSRPSSERGDENSREDSNSSSRRRTPAGSASSSALMGGRQQRFVARSRTIEDRSYRTSCCGRAAAAVAASSCHRRRTSMDNSGSSQLIRRRCPRCRDKAEPLNSKKVDVVIIFSKNCLVATQWISYLTSVLNNIFINEDRSSTRVTSRDVESLVHCDPQLVPNQDPNFARCDYQNDSAAELLEAERSSSQRAMRKTVETASLQIVLLSKPLLQHIGQHANDPLGQLLHPTKVIGLLLGLDESKDITPLHISALYSYAFWPKIVMLDQDMESVGQFRQQAIDILSRSQSVAAKDTRRFKLTPKKLRPGEERVTVLLLETAEGIQRSTTVHVAMDLTDNPILVQRPMWINPYTFSFDVPKQFLGRGITVRVQLTVNGISWGVHELKCQSKLSEISRLLDRSKSPMELMCTALNVSPSDVDAVDKALANGLDQRRVPLASHFRSCSVPGKSWEEFPTLLHFAARYGLRTFFWALLESCPFALSAINIQNRQGFTVSQLAEVNGHQCISTDLKSIAEVMEKDGIVALPEDLGQETDEDEDYITPPGKDTHPNKTRRKNAYKIQPGIKPTGDNDYVAPSMTVEENVYENAYDENEEVENKRKIIKKLSVDLMRAVVSEPNRGKTSPPRRKQSLPVDLKRQNVNTPKGSAYYKGSDSEDVANGTPRKTSAGTARRRCGDSRGPSPYTSWASSDRSSVASHMSQDSGTLSESNDDRKVRFDYDVQSSGRRSDYLVPPPPRPYKPNRPRSASPKLPNKNQHRYDTVEFSPPPSQNALGEDLGRILPNEEPLIFEQTSIPLTPGYPKNDLFHEDDDYIIMNASESTHAVDDDYLRSDEINAPAAFDFAKTRSQLMEKLQAKEIGVKSTAGSPAPARRRNIPPRH